MNYKTAASAADLPYRPPQITADLKSDQTALINGSPHLYRGNHVREVEPKSKKWDIQRSPFIASITSVIDLSALKF